MSYYFVPLMKNSQAVLSILFLLCFFSPPEFLQISEGESLCEGPQESQGWVLTCPYTPISQCEKWKFTHR